MNPRPRSRGLAVSGDGVWETSDSNPSRTHAVSRLEGLGLGLVIPTHELALTLVLATAKYIRPEPPSCRQSGEIHIRCHSSSTSADRCLNNTVRGLIVYRVSRPNLRRVDQASGHHPGKGSPNDMRHFSYSSHHHRENLKLEPRPQSPTSWGDYPNLLPSCHPSTPVIDVPQD